LDIVKKVKKFCKNIFVKYLKYQICTWEISSRFYQTFELSQSQITYGIVHFGKDYILNEFNLKNV
jgi:hypothetical protein